MHHLRSFGQKKNSILIYPCLFDKICSVSLTSMYTTLVFFVIYNQKKNKTSSICLKGYFLIAKRENGLYIYGYDSFFFFVYHNILFRKNRCLTYIFFFLFIHPTSAYLSLCLLFFFLLRFSFCFRWCQINI